MCILFFVTNVEPAEGEYRLILVNNRDEYYFRPTKVADFWDSNPNNIGGLDMEPGKEGGTWLGMNKSGKIGVLLNILQPVGVSDANKKGRGFLVPEFLNSDEKATSYLPNLHKEGQDYNTFNMVTIEINPKKNSDYLIGHYTNITEEEPIFLLPGNHGFGNSQPATPWRKVVKGRQKFSEIISRHKTVGTMDALIEEFLQMLNDDEPLFPDPQLEMQGSGRSEEVLNRLSALGVKIPSIQYGTRTNTIILVDNLNKVTYVERTMEEPVDVHNPQWITNKYNFDLS